MCQNDPLEAKSRLLHRDGRGCGPVFPAKNREGQGSPHRPIASHANRHREQLHAIIGAVDARLSVRELELVGSLERDALVYDGKLARVQRGGWSVFDRVHRERLLPLPKENP
jgi:hypothetical protein